MFGMLSGLSLLARAGIVLGLAAALVGGYAAWRYGLINQGVQQERQQQKERDDEAVGNADAGADAVRRCRDAGGMWSQSRGVCDRR